MKKKLVVFSGAGISAESGVKTFRDSDGLWENHRVEDVASPEGFEKNPKMVLDFYNARRRQLNEIEPNKAHLILAELEKYFDVQIITQNVDDLHERAGSTKIIHLHGELKKARPVDSENAIVDWEQDLNLGDLNLEGIQLRPHIVWFGEMVPEMDKAMEICSQANIFLVIGTSMSVYPAAGLISYIPENCEVFVIDPNLPNSYTQGENYFKTSATEGMELFKNTILGRIDGK
ncbi:SIR2 family NAD-dependent protein deacylase [Kaistella antarctica]|uniref:NAD-dependent protein deacylase n=1 Tax=Kaistella antarctica TaxID=266748 RepID=A0A3S5EUK4_9FLAO|nr:Sir2 family NAD-dependent protein deacetylase [Kaistella antarctica]KEY19521.1 NAD-dependent deacetylase [Kaistella antarctica]SEW07925.1 NAD-dependent deacetylase [Kaistella antarctica]VEH97247.1 NAD-dependent deacetylase [Kaistella antarctica]